MLRIERDSQGASTTLRLIGQITEEHIPELREEIGRATPVTALDLDEVRLAGRDAIRFLRECENGGIELLNCPRYVREWILQDRKSGRERR